MNEMNEYDSAAPNAQPSWIRTLARLWLLKPTSSAPRGVPGVVIAIIGVACLVAWVAIDRWQSGPEPQFFAAGIPLFAWYGLALILLAALLRMRSQPGSTPTVAASLAIAVGAVPVLLLHFGIVSTYVGHNAYAIVTLLVAVYTFLYLARAMRVITGESQRPAACAGLAFIAAFIWLTDAMDVIPDVWAPAQALAAAPVMQPDDAEAILFSQAGRIDQAIRGFAATAPATDKPSAFFLGFAGVGEQKEFAQEIGLASRVLTERYDIGSRRLSLLNDERDLHRAPIASVSGLKYALQGIGARMNRDRDVLFLAISSHGTEDPAIAVSNSQLPLDDLTSEDLSDALRESGIKWRVVIISACYSGAFIDSLRDPQSIVIAAAAPDRTSFGCANDRDLTYFGEAFYRDALPTARSLRDAFDKAKAAIGARERAEHITASNPQAYFGAQLEAKLSAIGTADR